MTNIDLVNKAKNVMQNYKTVYMNGVFGSPVSESIITQKTAQLPGWYTPERQAYLRSIIGKGYYGFDCICFIKGLLWGWNGDASKVYGGAVYGSNGVPDITEGQMLSKCTDVSTDFSNITPGEYLWLQGHCGIYLGDGLAVECTPKWNGGVQVTTVLNIGAKSGYNGRTWAKHGKLPYIIYTAENKPEIPSVNQITITFDVLRPGERRGDPQIGALQCVLKGKGYYSMDIDNSYGPGTKAAVMAYQADNKLEVDGIAGIKTLTKAYKG